MRTPRKPIDVGHSAALVNASTLLRAIEEGVTDETYRLIGLYRTMMEITKAINASLDLESVLRMVRDAAIEIGGFDRSGVWLVGGDYVNGAWGTDAAGSVRDERHIRQPLARWSPEVSQLRTGISRFYIEEWPEEDNPDGASV